MRRSLLLALALMAPCLLRAQAFIWSVPNSSASGQPYTVSLWAGTGSAQVTVLKNGYFFVQDYNYVERSTTDYGLQTVTYQGTWEDIFDHSSSSQSRSVQITASLNSPSPSIAVSVSGGVITVTASATDPDGDLNSMGIRQAGAPDLLGWWARSDFASGSATGNKVVTFSPGPGTYSFRTEVWDDTMNGATSAWQTVSISPPTYHLTVTGGSGSGDYEANADVSVSAGTPPNGTTFGYWAVYSTPGHMLDSFVANGTFRMGAGPASIEAIFQSTPTYTLTVVNGTGGWNELLAGAQRTIFQQVPAGTVFTGWSVRSGDLGTIADPSATGSTTTFTMGASNAVVTANYNDVQAPTPPGAPVASSISPTGFTLNWTASTDNVGVAAYQIEQNGTAIGEVSVAGKVFTGQTPGSTQQVRVRARDAAGNWSLWSGMSAAFTLPTPASIASQPQGVAVTAGQPATFTVAGAGSGPLNYQWTRNGINIPGATTATYTIASAMPSDAATYAVVVSNGWAAITSNGALLTVNQAALGLEVHRPQ